jgi:hypothetical protein
VANALFAVYDDMNAGVARNVRAQRQLPEGFAVRAENAITRPKYMQENHLQAYKFVMSIANVREFIEERRRCKA